MANAPSGRSPTADDAPAGLEERNNGSRPSGWRRPLDWWQRRHQGTTPEDRRRVIDSMFSTGGGTRTGRFWALQAFAIVIATMGLSANSAAVVIGAMLVAPLMTPIMAVATALALGWPQRAAIPLAGTILASAGSILLAFVLHALVATGPVTDEILARTSPDLRDLLVALAAGAAGALGTAREDVSASLPGVAVAVALVPPLATVGVCLQLGRTDLASGAFLLFTTNLVAIILAGILVLLWCGFVPARLIQRGRVAVWGGATATLLAVVAVGIPLTIRTVEAAEVAERTRTVTEAVLGWLDAQPGMELADLVVDDGSVRVDVTGPHEPVDVASLDRRVRALMDDETATTVRWSVRATAGDSAAEPPDAGTDLWEDGVTVIRSIVDAWAAGEPGIDVAGVSVGDTSVVVDVVGDRAPTSVGQLVQVLRQATGRDVDAEVRYSERVTIDGDGLVDRRARLAATAASEVGTDATVDAVRFDEDDDGSVERVVVDLSGEAPPADAAGLVEALTAVIDELHGFTDDPEVVVRFTTRSVLPLEQTPAES